MKNLFTSIFFLFCLLTIAQSNGKSLEEFTKDLSNMSQDLSIVNECNSNKRERIVLDTLNMNRHKLELFNTELIVNKIVNYGEIIEKCRSVVIETSKPK